jgi:predicted transcriptional regulator
MGQRRPTDFETEILTIVWRHGAVTVRQVVDELPASRAAVLTTVTTVMNRMVGKRLLQRAKKEQPGRYVYKPVRSENAFKRGLVHDLIAKFFGGSTHGLIQNALEIDQLSADELSELKKQIDKAKEEKP